MSSSLANIRVVLVEPMGPRNIGSTARAMKNFGLQDLAIIGGASIDHDECREMGVGAHDVLDRAALCTSLDDAIGDRHFIVGTTARQRRRRPTVTPREAATSILEETARGKVAILFGREDFGLFKEELQRCQLVVSANTSAHRTSINLSQAVLLLCYEIFQAAPELAVTASTDIGSVATDATLNQLYGELVRCCEITGYLHPGNRQAIEGSFARLLRMAPLQTRDTRHLFGLARRVEKILDGRATPPPLVPRQMVDADEDAEADGDTERGEE